MNALLMLTMTFLVVTPIFAVEDRSPLTPPTESSHGFTLVDKVCVVVEGETPILLSEIKRRSQQNSISLANAEDELIQERLLWVYARSQLKYDITGVTKAADDHIKSVIENNRLTESRFEEILSHPPYSMTFRQYQKETQTAILENNVKQILANQISVTDEQVKAEVALHYQAAEQKFDVIFITVHPDAKLANASQRLNAQIKKANDIKNTISPSTSLNTLRKQYGHDASVSILDPIPYERGALEKTYDERLTKEPTKLVIGPFEEKQSVSLIWKIKRPVQKLDETALEKVRKELYDRLVMEKFKAVTGALRDSSTVIVKGCSKKP